MSDDQPKLKTGDLVYRVAESDHPDKVPHTWKVVSRVVKKASAKQITLASFFPGHYLVQFTPDALGRVFFSAPSAAIEAFARQQRLDIENLDRRRKETERALAWAYAQGARVPT